MKMTSAQAAKELKKLNEEHKNILAMEKKSREFIATVQEDAESVRPKYDYLETQNELAEIEERIRKLKHEINSFNISQKVPGFDMTIDQMLVYLPQLNARVQKLDYMREKLPRERQSNFLSRQSALVEYSYTNYDIETVKQDYVEAVNELAAAQNALDQVNTTVQFEVNI